MTEMTDVLVIGGGQSGLAAARAAQLHGVHPVILEAGAEPVGSWPHYYDSLTLFSPTEYSGPPDMPFPGNPGHYPVRDQVVGYLRSYARTVNAEIHTGTRVTSVEQHTTGEFEVRTAGGDTWTARSVVAASGSFGNPYHPALPGADGFAGQMLHVANYRNPAPYAGQRVVVVGGGNSAVQVGYELAEVAEVTLATRSPLAFLPQRQQGRDLHYWLEHTGFDQLPPAWLARIVPGTLVLDTGNYAAALRNGRLDRRPMFEALGSDGVLWREGDRERVDTVLFATGYRPDLEYLDSLGALSSDGDPLHAGGLSTTHPGLGYVGLEFQRTFSSNTLRGVHRDAEYVMGALSAHVRRASDLVRT